MALSCEHHLRLLLVAPLVFGAVVMTLGGCDPLAADDIDDGTKEGCDASVDDANPLHGRFEAPTAENACSRDADCTAGGCSGEICAAEDMVSTCEELSEDPAGACGCLDGQCVWYVCE